MGSFARQNFTSTSIRFCFDRWRQYFDKYERLFRKLCECTSTNMQISQMIDTLTVTNVRKLPGDRDGATRYVTPDDKESFA
jgi:hypothetical protein